MLRGMAQKVFHAIKIAYKGNDILNMKISEFEANIKL